MHWGEMVGGNLQHLDVYGELFKFAVELEFEGQCIPMLFILNSRNVS